VKWNIAILTIPERKAQLSTLLQILDHQRQDFDDIEVILADQPGGIGEKRQWCLDKAQGEYFNFIDDDDMVAHNYISAIYPLLDGVDYVGFRLQHFLNGIRSRPTFHSLEHTRWWEDADGYYRNVTHLNPIKTEIARQGRFDKDYAEDLAWSEMVFPKTQHYIDRPMYFYFDRPEFSAARKFNEAS